MAFDVGRYNSLIARASMDVSFYKGTFQDLSPSARAMVLSGSPVWSRVNGLPYLKQTTAADSVASGAVASVADLTGSVWFEALCFPQTAGTATAYLMAQIDGTTTGFLFFWNNAGGSTGDFRLYLYNGGVVARRVYTNGSVAPAQRPWHIVIGSFSGGTSGQCWLNGVPITTNLLGAGVAANSGATNITVNGQSTGGCLMGAIAIRAGQGVITNADVAALYGAAKSLTGGEV